MENNVLQLAGTIALTVIAVCFIATTYIVYLLYVTIVKYIAVAKFMMDKVQATGNAVVDKVSNPFKIISFIISILRRRGV